MTFHIGLFRYDCTLITEGICKDAQKRVPLPSDYCKLPHLLENSHCVFVRLLHRFSKIKLTSVPTPKRTPKL